MSNGVNATLSLDNIAKLARALGVPAYRLLVPPAD